VTRHLPSTAARTAWALTLAALVAAQSGCVQRRLTIRSNPPGAVVFIDNEEIGATPIATDFIYYGAREIRLVKAGYETVTVLQEIPPPWYQYFPIDFFAENVVPYEIRDERVLDFQLRPQMMVPTEELLQRGEALRRSSRVDGFVPTPASQPLLTPPGTYEVVPPGRPLPDAF
jgi:hypothetical protein